MSDSKKNPDSFAYAFGLYGAVGFQLVICVVGGLFLGKWADGYFNSSPWFMIGGLFLGAVAGFYNLVRLLYKKGNP